MSLVPEKNTWDLSKQALVGLKKKDQNTIRLLVDKMEINESLVCHCYNDRFALFKAFQREGKSSQKKKGPPKKGPNFHVRKRKRTEFLS